MTCKHLGGRGLLLQRLALLGQQPRVLHRDHRLGSEILQQRDLLVGERSHLLAIDDDRHRAMSRPCAAARRARCGCRPARPRRGGSGRRSVRLVIRDIRDMHQALASQQTADARMSGLGSGCELVSGTPQTPAARPERRRMELLAVIGPEDAERGTRTAVSPFPASHRTPAPDRRAMR